MVNPAWHSPSEPEDPVTERHSHTHTLHSHTRAARTSVALVSGSRSRCDWPRVHGRGPSRVSRMLRTRIDGAAAAAALPRRSPEPRPAGAKIT